MNSLNPPGFQRNELQLKIRVRIRIIRKLHSPKRFNGTRLHIKTVKNTVLVPHIRMIPTDLIRHWKYMVSLAVSVYNIYSTFQALQ